MHDAALATEESVKQVAGKAPIAVARSSPPPRGAMPRGARIALAACALFLFFGSGGVLSVLMAVALRLRPLAPEARARFTARLNRGFGLIAAFVRDARLVEASPLAQTVGASWAVGGLAVLAVQHVRR